MRSAWAALAAVATTWAAVAVSAQTSHTPRSPRPDAPSASGLTASPGPLAPVTVPGYVATFEVRATAPGLQTSASAASEAQVLTSKLKGVSSLVSRVWLAQDISRQEILSTDSILPAGTLVLHKAGDKFYVIADPKAQTYVVMDSQALLEALEGSGGVINTQYEAKVVPTAERKLIAGVSCRKSIVVVTYVSSIPLENDRVAVQQKNEIEVWSTPELISSAALDHFFFKFQQDKTGVVQKTVSSEIGFPMEVNMVVTQGTGRKSGAPGSLHMAVTEVARASRLDASLFSIPPAGYRRTDKNVYFATAGAR